MNYESKINDFTENLYLNTLKNTKKYVGTIIKGKIYTNQQAENDAKKLTDDAFSFIESLYVSGLIDNLTASKIITSLSNNVHSINFLPVYKRGIYGEANSEEKTVYINPDLPEGKRTLYLFHELAHCCFDSCKYIPQIGEHIRTSTWYGYMTIEEALAQNVAEICYYTSINRDRPKKKYESDSILTETTYQTNFDFYGLYQPLATALGRTLRGVGKSSKDSDDSILFDLSKKALKENLLQSIINEYKKDGLSDDLSGLFFSLANIYSAKLKSFGMDYITEQVYDENQKLLAQRILNPRNSQVEAYYKNALEIMKKNEDYRPTTTIRN